jgi:LuxR family transcriptional regulator, maltose regulon positive regulatory protein
LNDPSANHPGGDGSPLFPSTKIALPRFESWQIARPRLLAKLDLVKARQVTVLQAGPGFGKTSLAIAWAERLRRTGSSVAWLALDAEDDEPTRFFFGVAQALHRANEHVGTMAIRLITNALVTPNTVVSSLVNDIADIEDDIFLFLDDYHRIGNAEIHKALSYLLKYAPDRFRLVIATRKETGLPLGRLRAQNRLFELDGPALSFDLEEIADFIKSEKLSALSGSELALLQEKTAGWPAVLRILAVTLSQSRRDFPGFVRQMSSGSRPINGYLKELFGGLPDDIAQFMLRLSVLDRFCAPLCQAVTGIPSSLELMERMIVFHLLLVPVDEEGRWFRFHPLLGSFLARVLKRRFPDEIEPLHRRAARWFADNRLWTDAITHAVAANDIADATAWIENCAMSLVKTGDLLTLLNWQRLFPATLMRGQRNVKLAIAWGFALAMRFEASLDLIAEVEHDVVTGPSKEEHADRCVCTTIRAVICALRDDTGQGLALANACLSKANDSQTDSRTDAQTDAQTDSWTENAASNIVRAGHWKSGDLAAVYAVPWIPFSSEEEPRNVFATVYRLCLQGLVEMQQLRIDLAERCYREALAQAERHAGFHSVPASLAACLMAHLRYEQGRFEEAETLVVDRLPIINATSMLDSTMRAYVVIARVAARRMNFDEAYTRLEQAESLAHARQWGRLLAGVLLERLRLYLAEGRMLEVDACLARLEKLRSDYPAPQRSAWSEIAETGALAKALVAIAQGRRRDALASLSTLSEDARAAQDRYLGLCTKVHVARALLSAGETAEANKVFAEVIATAARAGAKQTIIDAGREIGILIAHAADGASKNGKSEDHTSYCEELMLLWRDQYEAQSAPASPSEIAASLSPRERGILALICNGHSNKEIARQLGITAETVKSHIKHIFIKLGVDRRAQAVLRARALGLLSAN